MSSPAGRVIAQMGYGKAIGLSLMIGAFYYFNLYDDGSKLMAQIEQAKQAREVEEERKKETDRVKAEEKAIKEQVGALAEKFKEVTARFPVNLKSDEIIAAVNALSRSASVRVVSVRKEAVVVRELYEELPLSLELTGTFSNLLLLMYNIASLEKVTNLGDFEFRNLNTDYDGVVKLTMKVIGYRYRKPANSEDPLAKPSKPSAMMFSAPLEGGGAI